MIRSCFLCRQSLRIDQPLALLRQYGSGFSCQPLEWCKWHRLQSLFLSHFFLLLMVRTSLQDWSRRVHVSSAEL